jgi:hypothetical protein
MSRTLVFLMSLSAASFALAQSVSIDVPGVKLHTDPAGHVSVDSPNAEVRINDRTVQRAKPGTVVVRNGTTIIRNGAIVNAAGPGGRSEQVINGERSVVVGAGVVSGAIAVPPVVGGADGKSFVNIELADYDLSGRDLSDADFTNATLTNVDFRGADLRHANFTNAELDRCRLDGALIDGATFTNASLADTPLDKAIR